MYRYIFLDEDNIKQDVFIKASTWKIANERFYKKYKVKEVIRASKQ